MKKGEFQEIIKDYSDEELQSACKSEGMLAIIEEFIRCRNAGVIVGSPEVAKAVGKSRGRVDQTCGVVRILVRDIRRLRLAKQEAIARGHEAVLDLPVEALSIAYQTTKLLWNRRIRTLRDLTRIDGAIALEALKLQSGARDAIDAALAEFGLRITPLPPIKPRPVREEAYPKPRPIETAPKEEGAEILAWYPLLPGFTPTEYDINIRSGWFHATYWIGDDVFTADDEGVWQTGIDGIDEDHPLRRKFGDPTHWIPLPPDPHKV